MHRAEAESPTTHDHVWSLLPWYMNESLEPADTATVRCHLGECLVCAREVRRLEVLGRAVAAPLEEHACGRAFARLSEQIRADLPVPSWPQRLFGALRAVFEPVPLAAGASLLVFSSVLVATIVLNGDVEVRSDGQPFQTLGHQPTARRTTLSHPLLRIVLRDELDAGDLDGWLAHHGAELVDGPSEIGVMTVRLPMGTRTFDGVLADMRGDGDTLFVEPVSLIGTRPDRTR